MVRVSQLSPRQSGGEGREVEANMRIGCGEREQEMD
jgi:hypothetical protein